MIRRNLGRLAVTAIATSAVLATSFSSAAFAAETTAVTVSGGSLAITTLPTVADFGAVTLNGTATTTTAAFDGFQVNDATGSGLGWNVTVQATQFAEINTMGALVTGGKTLAQNSLSMAAPTVAANGTTSPAPSITAGPYKLDSGTAVKIAAAAVDTGMGKYDFTQTAALTLSIPASAYAKTYQSTLTVSTVSGP